MQILSNLSEMRKDDVLVIEVSNRQLRVDLARSPHIAVITNVSPNHLDDHKNYEDYINTKRSLLKYQTDSNFAVLNSDNDVSKEFSAAGRAKPYLFSAQRDLREGCFMSDNELVIRDNNREYKICSAKEILLPGLHNVENVLAASLAAFLTGVSTKFIREMVTSFSGLSSRLELVEEIRSVKYYEDSSACNPDGPRAAVQSFKEPMILIAGGSRKKTISGEFNQMAESVARSNVKVLLLIGERADNIEQSVRRAAARVGRKKLLIKQCETLNEAVSNAYSLAEKGDVVILSPGCESFGMFNDYRDRGRQFKRLVKKLK
jgi:UDP-N-acetylmuramoylalanine--D-glutamate ligase